MPFIDEKPLPGAIAIPDGLNVTPDTGQIPDWSIGSIFRQNNELASEASAFRFDKTLAFDPDFDPFRSIQGSKYEDVADRFSGAQSAEDVAGMKLQIDMEENDRAANAAGGWPVTLMSIGASILSPTSLLPGGSVIRGLKGGVSIGKTALSVAGSAGLATAIQEAGLQDSQQLRTGQESAVAIGGAVLLGGLLGAAMGKLTSAQVKVAGAQAEAIVADVRSFNDTLQNMGAAQNIQDFRLRREKVFQAINAIPILRGFVRSDPILRTQLSDNLRVREATAKLVETPLQYKVAEDGQSVLNGDVSVETRIKDRERNDLSKAISIIWRSFAEYSKDGPVGFVGTMTAPITARFQNLMGRSEKLNSQQFMEEFGKAMRDGDKHPIPQIQTAADALRREIFDKIKDEAIELGIFDPDLKITNADSYFTRVYNIERIRQHFGDDSADDIQTILRQEFRKRRDQAQKTLAFDRSVDELESQAFRARETITQSRRAQNKALDKSRAKRDRAKGAVMREGAVERASGALRRVFGARADDLNASVMSQEVKDSLRDALADARGLKSLEPLDIVQAIRERGGIKDPRGGGMWNGKDWSKGARPTELEGMFGGAGGGIRNNKSGRSLDDLRESLVEGGYLPEGSTETDLLDAIDRNVRGDKVYSLDDAQDLERFQSAQEFAAAMDELGIDISKPIDEIIGKLPEMARNQKTQKAKAGEAARSGKTAGKVEDAAGERVLTAIDRLEDAKARLTELMDEVGPKVKAEMKAAKAELDKILPELKKAKKAREGEEFYASASDAEVDTHVRETVQALLGMKAGEHSYGVSLASPTRARVLDVADSVLEPWLESNAEVILSQYFRSMVPDLEIIRTFGDVGMTEQFRKIQDENIRLLEAAPSRSAKKKVAVEGDERVKDLAGMRDRMRGAYGVPANPNSGWVQGTRIARSGSYMGYLGGMTLSAIPDVAGVVGRNGIGGAFGGIATLLTDPKRFLKSTTDMADVGAASEWFLNSRAMSVGEMFDPYGRGTKAERIMGQGARVFSIATGMIPWNVAWKSVGSAMMASRISKAADAMRAGKATKSQMLALGGNGIPPFMAERIAKQLDAHADKDGMMWLPQGRLWDDPEAFAAFRYAINRESDLMVVTPGQDKPLFMSTEVGKFFSQFKSFCVSSHHRILLAGIQRADADVIAQFTMAAILGGLVSNIKADIGGYDRKEGAAFWEDAIDKSGLAGWLMEPYGALGAASGGRTTISGETVSRFQSRSTAQGLLGPSVDMGVGIMEAVSAFARGDANYRDVRKLMRPIPGNNVTWLLPLFQMIEDAVVSATGAKPRP